MSEFNDQREMKQNLVEYMESEAIGDVDKYFQQSNFKELPIIRVFEDSGSELPSDQHFENQGESVFDEIGLEKLQLQSVQSDGRATSWSHTDDNKSQKKYLQRPRTSLQLSNKIVESNQNLFNVHYAKSLYTNKISQLVDKQISTNPTRLSKSQQKIKRKSSQQLNETSDLSKSSQQSGGEQSEDRLARNRVAARNSRARKRLYFELLETKVKDLQDEIDRLNELCQTQTQQLKKYKEQEENFQQILDNQKRLLEQLEICQLKDQNGIETQNLLNEFRQYQLDNDIEQLSNQKLENLINILLPIEIKYIILSYDQNKDLLSEFQNSYFDWMKEAYQLADIKQDQLKKIRKQKERLNCVKKTIINCIKSLYTNVKQIINETNKCQQIWSTIYENLEPQQLRVILLTIHQNQHRPIFESNSMFSDCKYLKSQNQSDSQRPSKLRQFIKNN